MADSTIKPATSPVAHTATGVTSPDKSKDTTIPLKVDSWKKGSNDCLEHMRKAAYCNQGIWYKDTPSIKDIIAYNNARVKDLKKGKILNSANDILQDGETIYLPPKPEGELRLESAEVSADKSKLTAKGKLDDKKNTVTYDINADGQKSTVTGKSTNVFRGNPLFDQKDYKTGAITQGEITKKTLSTTEVDTVKINLEDRNASERDQQAVGILASYAKLMPQKGNEKTGNKGLSTQQITLNSDLYKHFLTLNKGEVVNGKFTHGLHHQILMPSLENRKEQKVWAYMENGKEVDFDTTDGHEIK